jgi:hypothetical protein
MCFQYKIFGQRRNIFVLHSSFYAFLVFSSYIELAAICLGRISMAEKVGRIATIHFSKYSSIHCVLNYFNSQKYEQMEFFVIQIKGINL